MFHHVLIATDFSHDANHAVTVGAGLAQQLGARVTLLHVIQMPSYAFFGGGVFQPAPELMAQIRGDASRWLGAARARLRGVEADSVCLEGEPARAILEWAERHRPDVIVVGTSGRRGLTRALLGSVAGTLLREARCPVLTVRGERAA